jgi:vancomycin resistance protein YoaR
VKKSDRAPSGGRSGRRWALLLGGLALATLSLYALGVWRVSGPGIAKGTTLGGVAIGGMSEQEAVQTLRAETAPISVTAAGVSTNIRPRRAGLSVDWEASVAQVPDTITSPAAVISRLTGSVDVEPVLRSDTARMELALAGLAAQVLVPAVEPSITFSRGPTIESDVGVAGTELDLAASGKLVRDAFLSVRERALELPMTPLAPEVSDAEAAKVAAGFATQAISAPVTVAITVPAAAKAKLVEIEASPTDIARSLSFSAEAATLSPTVDGSRLRRRLGKQLQEIEVPGRDARIRIRDEKPVVVSSRSGKGVNSDELSAAVLTALPLTGEARRANVTLSEANASFTTAQAKALGITEKLSSFRQWFPPAAYRYQNVGQAAAYLDGTILRPGETFSMNDTIKERTPQNGYTKGFIISGGRFREELGGGVSIITTATWTAGFHAGLERVEQRAHGLYISRYQAGLEATVAWGQIDLRMRNDTGSGVLITATRYNDGVRIEMWGKKKFEKVTASFTERHSFTDFEKIVDDSESCVPSEGVRGFTIAVTRRRYVNDKVASKETWPTTYRATPKVECTNPKASKG